MPENHAVSVRNENGQTTDASATGRGNDAPAKKLDAGAMFVLESKGNWRHAGFHLTTSIAAPPLLSLPFAMTGLGWAPGLLAIFIGAAVSFYAYVTLSQVLEQAELQSHRCLRFRDLGGYVLGRKRGYYPIATLQIAVCLGSVIALIILGGQSLKLIYSIYQPNGALRLYEFIIFFGIGMLVLSQLPSFHSLRYINLASLLSCLGYSLCAVGGCIYAGRKTATQEADYAVVGTPVSKMFGVFNSLAIVVTTFGNGIIPEIQATLAPPVAGKMFKGLLICYAVVLSTFFSVAVSGYWKFGNAAPGNVLTSLAPLIPNWLSFLANFLVLAQLFAVALVYSQPTFEIFEGRWSDSGKGKFSGRNLIPRIILRSLYVALATLVAAALPFFGDFAAIIGAFGFTPLDFVMPFVFYAVTFNPSPRSFKFWLHYAIIIVFTLVGALGCISSVRQVALDASSYQLFANL